MPLIGNRVTEADLRKWLDGADHYGRSARIEELELVAAQRPGWVQLFRFRAEAKNRNSGDWEELVGLMRDDDRQGLEVCITRNDTEYAKQFAEWSTGLLVTERNEMGVIPSALVLFGLFFVGMAAVVAILKSGG